MASTAMAKLLSRAIEATLDTVYIGNDALAEIITGTAALQ